MGYGLMSHADTPGGDRLMYSSSYFVPATSYSTACSPFVSGYNGGGGGGSCYHEPTKAELAEERRREKELERNRTVLERLEAKRLANRTLADLSEESKEKIMDHVYSLLKEYHRTKEVKKMMSDVKWFLVFLGLAVLFNFGRILNIVQQITTCAK